MNDAQQQFEHSCKTGDLSCVKRLLAGSLINDYDLRKGFFDSCPNGHLEVVKYLLTNENLKVDIHSNKYWAFRSAAENGCLEVVRYLLTSPELTDHADLHSLNDEPFSLALLRNHIDIVKYFIFELNIVQPDSIKKALNKHSEVREMFELRDAAIKEQTLLNNILPDTSTVTKRIKL